MDILALTPTVCEILKSLCTLICQTFCAKLLIVTIMECKTKSHCQDMGKSITIQDFKMSNSICFCYQQSIKRYMTNYFHLIMVQINNLNKSGKSYKQNFWHLKTDFHRFHSRRPSRNRMWRSPEPYHQHLTRFHFIIVMINN